MFRRLLIIMLTLAVPAQGFAVPHSHGMVGGGELDPHPQTPHFHIGHQHHHDHQHPGGHQHSHHEAVTPAHAHHDSGEQSEHPEQHNGPHDSGSHDDDAMFVAGNSGLNLTKGTRQVTSGVEFVFWAVSEPPNKLCSNPLHSLVGRSPVFTGIPLFLSALSLRL